MVSLGMFCRLIPSGRTVALGLTQPLSEMSTSVVSWGVNAGGAWGRQPCYIHMPMFWKFWEPEGPFQVCIGTVYHYLVLNTVVLTMNGWTDKQQHIT